MNIKKVYESIRMYLNEWIWMSDSELINVNKWINVNKGLSENK